MSLSAKSLMQDADFREDRSRCGGHSDKKDNLSWINTLTANDSLTSDLAESDTLGLLPCTANVTGEHAGAAPLTHQIQFSQVNVVFE